MDCGPKLQKLSSSCSCPGLNPTCWCSNSRRGPGLGRSYAGSDEFGLFDYSGRSDEPRWQILWRKIRKEIFPSSGSIRVPYDPYTYAQNFDQGLTWLEPENLSRSFSARFAYPSRIFHEIR